MINDILQMIRDLNDAGYCVDDIAEITDIHHDVIDQILADFCVYG